MKSQRRRKIDNAIYFFKKYGITLSRDNVDSIIQAIQRDNDPSAKFIKKESVRFSIWLVKINESEFFVTYDKQLKTIHRFLTKRENKAQSLNRNAVCK